MNNAQVAAARKALFGFPDLKVTIGKVNDFEEIIPYLKDDVFTRGAPVKVSVETPPEQITRELNASCAALVADNG
ncbi:hypothetical protein [Ponticaulis sp.]|uniref:hypothetical protein n=1 Tax=Ponticaulis sp. TaxID=2020902 RepID=UPI000C4872A0|nr:hypothetical protein [Ponticaulis sp.]MAF57812.1 hypothetical protein [Ponticaulis sp.]MBN04521.1 hypothetical protein [Ponticaulis sp.]|tara:strand:+ start:820 stop:1044 length:225 start_codon:yes stop_codon:yes gene_type:complete